MGESQTAIASAGPIIQAAVREAAATPVDSLVDQAGLISAVEAARRRYAEAENDMQKGAARPIRAQAICAVLHGRTAVEGWTGTVVALSTNGDGKGVLAVNIGSGVSVKTWNNGFSDIGSDTLIDPASQLFAMASQLHKGQTVHFSGTFFPSSTDCVHETSLTMSGSINEPEFLFRFRLISAE